MTTKEGNKLIAEFMGLKHPRKSILGYDIKCGWDGLDFDISHWWIKKDKDIYLSESLKYHSSWDWLMPVVEKIEKMEYWIEICHSHLGTNKRPNPITWCEISKENHRDLVMDDCYTKISRGEGTMIEATWLAVVEFIQWYNQNQK